MEKLELNIPWTPKLFFQLVVCVCWRIYRTSFDLRFCIFIDSNVNNPGFRGRWQEQTCRRNLDHDYFFNQRNTKIFWFHNQINKRNKTKQNKSVIFLLSPDFLLFYFFLSYRVLTSIIELTSLSLLNRLNNSSDSNFAFWSGTTRGILKMNLGFGCSYKPIESNGNIPARAAVGSFIACIIFQNKSLSLLRNYTEHDRTELAATKVRTKLSWAFSTGDKSIAPGWVELSNDPNQ